MKRLTILLMTASITVMAITSCSKYLDVVPPNTPTLNDAFSSVNSALNFFYSLYSYQYQPNNTGSTPDIETTDEVAIPNWNNHISKSFRRGQLGSSAPLYNIWSKGGLYDGIRQCYIFLDNIDRISDNDISAADKSRMKGDATFLIAYYHFMLLRMYGPIVTVPGETSLDATTTLVLPSRQPYDSCVNFISNLFDKAANLLPPTVGSQELGRATSVACKAIKARMLLYAASPLFNGNAEYYSNFKNPDGTPLINLTYDPTKWKRAADAALDAIQSAQSAGVQLYTYPKNTTSMTAFQQAVNNYRYTMVDPWNAELIFGYTLKPATQDIFTQSCPRVQGKTYNGESPTLQMVESYYTANGLPIDKDPSFNYAGRYQISGSNPTINLHYNREPRFYASVAYDRGYYAVNTSTSNPNGTQMLLRMGETHGWSTGQNDFSPSGYLQQKGINPGSVLTTSQISILQYPWPISRLSELYLDYAEALNEYSGTAAQSTVLQYIDPIRTRSGIPGVQASWALIGKTSFTQDEMRAIIWRERTIELAFEGHRFWDIRRWKMGATVFTNPIMGMNIQGSTAATFYQPTQIEVLPFLTPAYYLFPISVSDISVNPKLVQNPGW